MPRRGRPYALGPAPLASARLKTVAQVECMPRGRALSSSLSASSLVCLVPAALERTTCWDSGKTLAFRHYPVSCSPSLRYLYTATAGPTLPSPTL
jgi:hypothetical protein